MCFRSQSVGFLIRLWPRPRNVFLLSSNSSFISSELEKPQLDRKIIPVVLDSTSKHWSLIEILYLLGINIGNQGYRSSRGWTNVTLIKTSPISFWPVFQCTGWPRRPASISQLYLVHSGIAQCSSEVDVRGFMAKYLRIPAEFIIAVIWFYGEFTVFASRNSPLMAQPRRLARRGAIGLLPFRVGTCPGLLWMIGRTERPRTVPEETAGGPEISDRNLITARDSNGDMNEFGGGLRWRK